MSSAHTAYYECDSAFIPAHYQPATLLDLAMGRGCEHNRLLRGTGLFHDDILAGARVTSPEKFLLLIANAQRLLPGDEISFLLGQRLLPGHFGACSHALRNAATLQGALELLAQRYALLSPLLRPRLWQDERWLWICWGDACGLGERRRFVVESMCAAVVALSRGLLRERLPWEFFFTHERPGYIEQYWVHLGQPLRFGQPLNAMRIARVWAMRPCPDASATISHVLAQQSEEQVRALGVQASLLDGVYTWLQQAMRQSPSLEQTAAAFQCSSATLKRKLQKHGTGFQELLDQVRMEQAIQLYLLHGYSNEQVADYLQFHDAANFRRSFKRWTGVTPSLLRKHLGLQEG